MKTRLIAVALAPLLALGLFAGFLLHSSAVHAQQAVALNPATSSSGTWEYPAGDYANLRHSGLTAINTDNVKSLRVAWMMSTGATRGHEGQPLVIGDTLYYESA